MMRKLFEYGGILAGVVLVGFGIASLVLGINGRSVVSNSLKQEKIVGTPDMTPAAIREEAQKAKLVNVDLPTCNVAGKPIDSGSRARCFASYMRIHALEATGGQTYAEMGRYLDAKGQPTNDIEQAKKTPKGQPVENPLRAVWVTETSLATALNVSYMAERVSLFSVVVGVALLLSGIGFLILALGGALRHRGTTLADSALAAAHLRQGTPAAS
jgi:hypothetical protein